MIEILSNPTSQFFHHSDQGHFHNGILTGPNPDEIHPGDSYMVSKGEKPVARGYDHEEHETVFAFFSLSLVVDVINVDGSITDTSGYTLPAGTKVDVCCPGHPIPSSE